jgi:hypothetical protein
MRAPSCLQRLAAAIRSANGGQAAACATALLLVAAGPLRAEDVGLEALLGEFARTERSQASFVEEKQVAMLKEPIRIEGTLRYEAPSRLEKRVDRPVRERYVVEGPTLRVERPASRTVGTFDLSREPLLGAFVESVRGVLAGDLRALTRFYAVALEGRRDRWRLSLTPRLREMADLVTVIRMEGSGARILRVETVETNGDRSVMTIRPEAS